MLGIFKGRSKEKNNSDVKKNGELKNLLKKSKSQEKSEKETKEKFSRFSFRRSKSLDKKRTKDRSHTLFMVSSTPSLIHEKDVQNEASPENSESYKEEEESESLSISTNTISSNDTPLTSEALSCSDNLSPSPLPTSSVSDNSISNSSKTSTSSIVSEKFLQNCKTYPRKLSLYERPSKTTTSQCAILSNHFCSTPAILSSGIKEDPSTFNEQPAKYPPSSVSDGSASMLSTPSSSTSSLSSITGRPISPSGRRTPPGPKLGTGGRIPSSPTTIRKTVRTNIKTNPTASGRRQGSLPSSPSLGNADDKMVNSSDLEKNEGKTNIFKEPSPGLLTPIVMVSQSPEHGTQFLPENLQSPPQSPSPSIGRTRLSVSSMQSLESIPENENDLIASTTEQNNLASRKYPGRKLPPKLNANVVDLKSKSPTAILQWQEIDETKDSETQSESVVPVTDGGNIANVSSKDETRSQNEITIQALLTKKPPLVSKRHKDSIRPTHTKDIKEKTKLKLFVTKDSLKENITNENTLSKVPRDPDKKHKPFKLDLNKNNPSFKPKSSEANQPPHDGERTLKNSYIEEKNEESGTHVIFRIPVSTPNQNGRPMKKATSLEILTSSTTKLSSRDEIFPKSSSPVRTLNRRRRSISLPKFPPSKEETDVKFEIPITIEELRNQAEVLGKSLETRNKSLNWSNIKSSKQGNSLSKSFKIKIDENVNHRIGNITFDINQRGLSNANPKNSDLKQMESPSLIAKSSRIEDQPTQDPKTHLTSKDEKKIISKTKSSKEKQEETEKDGMKGASEAKFSSCLHKWNGDNVEAGDVIERSDSSDETTESNSCSQPSNGKEESNFSEHLETDSTCENSDSQNIIQEAITFQIDNENRQIKSLIQTKDKTQDSTQTMTDDTKTLEKSNKTKLFETVKAFVNKSFQTDDSFLEQESATLAIHKEELANQENKYQSQIDDLTLKLAEKQQEVTDLVEKLSSLGSSNQTSSRETELEIEIEDMKKQVKLKENMAESINVDLQYTKNQNTIAQMKLERLEEELSKAKVSLDSLQEQNSSNARECARLKEVEAKMKSLEEELRKSEVVRKDLQESLTEIEAEREDELKIVQDALDEAAQEREELIMTFEKELKHLNTTNSAREQQMLEDFEWKLREMEKDHKSKLEEKERQLESTLQRVKCHADEEELRQKVEKMKSELNAKWEDKLRSECSRLKSELDELHSEEKHLAVESMKVQKEQEMQALKKSWERTQEEMTKEISTLKDSLSRKDAYHHKEMDSQRTIADRDIWDLRMKLQKLNESSYDKQQQMEEKHKEDMERFRIDYEERIHEIERRLAARDAEAGVDHLGELEKEHKRQMDHLEEQHRLSMERLREELESDKFQAVEEARVILSKNHEYVESNFKDQINEYVATIAQCREELESLRASLARKDESLRSLRDQIERGHEYRSTSDPLPPYSPGGNPGLSSSQFSLASSSDSQGSRSSQDKFYLPENTGVVEVHEDTMNGQRASTPGLLGKVFGVGWFGPQKGKEVGRRGSTPLSSKKAYGS